MEPTGGKGYLMQPIENTKRTVNRIPARCLPSQVPTEHQEEIVMAIRQGRSVAQTAKEWNVTRDLAIEFWNRRIDPHARKGPGMAGAARPFLVRQSA